MTCVTSSMSMPRAATSVATMTSTVPSRNSLRLISRSGCFMSPWTAPTAKPKLARSSAMVAAWRLVRAKTMLRPRPGVCRIRASAESRSILWDWKAIWVVVVCVASVAALSAWTMTGWFMKVRVSATMGPGMVAEKTIVWRCGLVRESSFWTSSRKPWASISSASSSTAISTPERSRSSWRHRSSSRPGVPTMTSTPRSMAVVCLSKPTPP